MLPAALANAEEITGRIRPIALCDAIHEGACHSWGGVRCLTLKNIRDCIEAGDRWFVEEVEEGFRVFCVNGLSAIVRNKLWLKDAAATEQDVVTTAIAAGCLFGNEAGKVWPYDPARSYCGSLHGSLYHAALEYCRANGIGGQ